MVTRMDALFLVDRHARQEQMSDEARLVLRQQHAETWAEEIRSECQALSRSVLPKSALGQAVTYTLNMWQKLRRCFDPFHAAIGELLEQDPHASAAVILQTGERALFL